MNSFFMSSINPFHAIVRKLENNHAVLQVVHDHMNPKHNVWGIVARNREQNFALNLLMNPGYRFCDIARPSGYW